MNLRIIKLNNQVQEFDLRNWEILNHCALLANDIHHTNYIVILEI